jgi:hypothetical protein
MILVVTAAAAFIVRTDRDRMAAQSAASTTAPAGSPDITSPPRPSGLSVREVYKRAALALGRPGLVYQEAVTYADGSRAERWVDTAHDQAREEVSQPDQMRAIVARRGYMDQIRVIAGGGEYTRYHNGSTGEAEAAGCYGVNAAAALVLGCPSREGASAKVEGGRYGGRDVVILVLSGSSRGSDDNGRTYVSRLYLDGETFLPVGSEIEGTVDYGDREESYSNRGERTHKFVPAQSLPRHFFNPRSIGALREPDKRLLDRDWGIPMYWLGREYGGRGKLPPLVLTSVAPAPKGDPYKFELEYRLPGRTYKPVFVLLQELPTSAGRALSPASGSCLGKKEVGLPSGRALIYSSYSYDEGGPLPVPRDADRDCRGRAPNEIWAHVYLESSIVTVSAHGEGLPDSYDSVEGLEAIVRALHEREPTR